MWLAIIYLGKGDIDRAEEAVENCESPDCIGARGMILGLRGHRDEALKLLERPELADSGNLKPILQSWIYLGIGDLDAAFDLLHEAVPGGNSYLLHVRQWAIFDPLRDDPRYQDLLQELGLPERP
jgi:tetratricopeptide (TPR) repeat protein